MDLSSRKTAHTLLDFYGGFAASEDLAEQELAFTTSMARLNSVEAITASQNEEGTLSLDFTPVLLASGVTYQWLFDRLSSATGRSSEELAFELRAFIDGLED